MGLTEEYQRARAWVVENLTVSLIQSGAEVSVFETTIRYIILIFIIIIIIIRYLGGLLSTYSLTGDAVFKEKAVEVADRLLPAFTSSGKYFLMYLSIYTVLHHMRNNPGFNQLTK